MDVIKTWIKYINFPLAMRRKGNWPCVITYNDCIKNQYRSYNCNLSEQLDHLYEIVNYAINHVPYYQELVSERHLTFTRENIMEDIKQLPIITKEIIRKEGESLYSTEKIDYEIDTSGGSTGEPVKLLHDKYMIKMRPGTYFLSYAGYDIGDKLLLLWGSERDILHGSIGWKAQMMNKFVWRRKLLNSFLMTPEDMQKYVHIINKWKPKVILAYTQSAYELAKFIKDNHLEVFSPMGIVVSAGTLYSDWEKEIRDAFKCPVINQYGSRETPAIAVSCAESGRLHINTFLNYVEIVDELGNNLPCDVDGTIIVTNLVNKSMPLLRYQIGDVGSLSSEKECKCGRGLPCLNHVTGRTVNIFKRKDGAKIDGEYFTHLFYGVPQVEKFQVIQNDYEEISINLQVKESLDNKVEQEIKSNIRVVMGETCNITINYVDKVLPTKSGKYLYTISYL